VTVCAVVSMHDRAALELRLAPAGGAAHQGVDAGQQFLDVEGLDQVVVGAGLQAFDLVLPAAERAVRIEDRDTSGRVLLAQLAGSAPGRSSSGQAEVDDREIEGHFLAEEHGLPRRRPAASTA
jgi:hypothetical protein